MSGRGLSASGAPPVATGQSVRGRGIRNRASAVVEAAGPPLAQEPPTVQAVPSRGRGRGLGPVHAAAQSPVGDAPGLPGRVAGPAAGSQESVVSIATSVASVEHVQAAPPPGQARSVRGRGRGGRGRGAAHAPTAIPTGVPAAGPEQATPAGDSGASSKPKQSAPLSLSDLQKALEDRPKVGANSKRKDRGTTGTKIKLRSNCYAVEFPDAVWHKYDVEIYRGNEKEAMELENLGAVKVRDRIASRHFNREILLKVFFDHAKHLGDELPAYDGRKILIMNHQPFKEQEKYFNVVIMSQRQRKMEFTVRLKHTLRVDVSLVKLFYTGQTNSLDPEVIQAVNIVIDASFGNSKWVAVGRSYYDPASIPKYLGGGKEMREGIYTSAMFADWRPLLIVDKARTAFSVTKPLMDYSCDVLGINVRHLESNTFNSRQLDTLRKELKALMVKLEHTTYGRSVKIAGLTLRGANQVKFKNSEGADTAVTDYFRTAYPNFRLRYPHLPCIEVNRANGTKTDYFPMEVCTVKKDQPSRKKLNPEQTAQMIRFAQDRPQERLDFSDRSVSKISSGRPLRGFGVKVSANPTQTFGRTIKDPGIIVGRQNIPVSVGSWKLPAFHEAVEVRQWVIVDCAGVHPGQLDKLGNLLFTQANKLNMRMPKVARTFSGPGWRLPPTTRQVLEEVKQYHRDESRPLLAVIVLARDNNYSEIKSLTETTEAFKGIVTQCAKAENIANERKLNFSFVENLLKKINAKLGGVNNLVREVPRRFQENYMILGADVSHPSPGDVITPSIAALVGSMDYKPSKYCTEVSVQCSEDKNRIEYIVNLRRYFLKLLKRHLEYNNDVKPKHIYYFRDGVSDGQFEEVRIREVTAIREACYDLQVHYQPFITVIVAQKRHHVRFAVVDTRDGTRSGNIPPGTYIDNDVVHPINHDLYMYTHEGLVGTSRPTHYQIIHSDSEIKTDEVTEMIYYLTHNYVRASKSVSIPSPIYYAHLAAFRAKEHVKADPTLCGSSAASTDSGVIQIDLERYQKACEVDERTKQRLYYV